MLLVGREVAGGVPPLQLLQGEGAGVWSQSLGVGGGRVAHKVFPYDVGRH